MGTRHTKDADAQLAEAISEFYDDPLGYVMFAWDWEHDTSIQVVPLVEPWKSRYAPAIYGPDAWACQFLDDLGAEIRKRGFDGRNAVAPIRFSTASGHGIGKSVLVAMLVKFILDTRPHSKGVVTAMTVPQLKTKTWAEVGRWHKRSITSHLYKYTSGQHQSLQRIGHEETWRADAQTSKEENSESFAGLHAATGTPFYIFDEASGIPEKIFEVREGGQTDGEPMVFDFGNPTRNSGAFFENTAGKQKDRYLVRQIDSRTVHISNKPLIKEWLELYGEDSDFFKVRVRGEFPAAGALQFIPTSSVLEAMKRPIVVNKFDPAVIGVDVARFGIDHCVIYPRIGMDARSISPERFRFQPGDLVSIEIAGRVARMANEMQRTGYTVAAIFVDGSGGYGGGVIDQLRALGFANVHEIQFGGSPIDGKTYRFKVDEMWGRMRDALKTRLAIIDTSDCNGARLKEELTQREYGITTKGQVNLESKEDLKERLGEDASPDMADALALTFAHEIAPTQLAAGANTQTILATSDYDPYKDAS